MEPTLCPNVKKGTRPKIAHYYISLTILYIVSFINSADVIGATFPGNDNAHTNLSFLSFTAFLSIPPGFEAKSISRQSSFYIL